MLWKCCPQYDLKLEKPSSGHRAGKDRKGKDSLSIPKKGNAKEFSNYHTTVLISQASKVMLKILQVRL